MPWVFVGLLSGTPAWPAAEPEVALPTNLPEGEPSLGWVEQFWQPADSGTGTDDTAVPYEQPPPWEVPWTEDAFAEYEETLGANDVEPYYNGEHLANNKDIELSDIEEMAESCGELEATLSDDERAGCYGLHKGLLFRRKLEQADQFMDPFGEGDPCGPLGLLC